MKAESFSRIVIGLYHNARDDSVRIAAEVADLLRLELLGLFIEEQDLLDLAAMPFVREFRPLGGGWCRLDAAQLARDLDDASRSARRRFTEAAKGLQKTAQFQTVRGSLADTIASILRAGDIVIVAEPAHPAEQVANRFGALMRAAFRSAAAVLIVPRHVVRRSGAVVAIAASPDDPAIAAAAAIAVTAGEDLVVVEADHLPAAGPSARAISLGDLKVIRISLPRELASAVGIAAALSAVRDRLVVISRDAFGDALPLALAAVRGVPVLVMEPADGA